MDDVDQSSNRVAENYGRDLLVGLEPDAILLTRGDHNYTSLVYAQLVTGVRPDVRVVESELMQLGSYVDEYEARDPSVVFPYKAYVPNRNTLGEFIDANIDRRPVYLAGPMPAEILDDFHEVRAGVVRRVVRNGEQDEYDIILSDPEVITHLNYPEVSYPEKTWENLMARNYGVAIHSLAFAFHEPSPTDDDPMVEEMYRLSIHVGPPPEAYKNLGLFLFQRNRNAEEIVELWETYLALDTGDPQADALRTALRDLKELLEQAEE